MLVKSILVSSTAIKEGFCFLFDTGLKTNLPCIEVFPGNFILGIVEGTINARADKMMSACFRVGNAGIVGE